VVGFVKELVGWVVSSSEQPLIKKKWPCKSIQVVSNIVDAPGSNTPFALRRDWLFIGSFQPPPNIDAVLFFLKEIYPLLSKHLGDAKFYINRLQSASGDRRVGN
jgi:hypothetical protein